MMSKFKVGDRVYDVRHGITVISTIRPEVTYAVYTLGGNSYTTDGRYKQGDLNPSLLTLVEARSKGYDVPKIARKVTKTVSRWVNVYPDFSVCYDYNTRQEADAAAKTSLRIACVELTGTYEVEEEVV